MLKQTDKSLRVRIVESDTAIREAPFHVTIVMRRDGGAERRRAEQLVASADVVERSHSVVSIQKSTRNTMQALCCGVQLRWPTHIVFLRMWTLKDLSRCLAKVVDHADFLRTVLFVGDGIEIH